MRRDDLKKPQWGRLRIALAGLLRKIRKLNKGKSSAPIERRPRMIEQLRSNGLIK